MSREKRHRPWCEDDFSDSEETSSSADTLDSSQDSGYSNNATTRQQQTLELRSTHVSHIADRAFPAFCKYISKAYYIKPPDYRIPTRKRRCVLLETEDPSHPSIILVVRVDGYLPLACPVSSSSCALQHSLRSIPDVIKHLTKHHPNPIYCPICGDLFDMDLSRDTHIQGRSCTRREFNIANGVSRSQLEEIVEEDDRNQCEEER